MSTLQFPANPVVGDTYDWDAYKYVWDGEKWKTVGIGYNPVNDLRDELEPRISNNESKVFEALRRSYAEAGYNVVGTFKAGFTIVNANDVGIDLATGKGFTGPFGPVVAGTDPASGSFVDVSMEMLPVILSAMGCTTTGDNTALINSIFDGLRGSGAEILVDKDFPISGTVKIDRLYLSGTGRITGSGALVGVVSNQRVPYKNIEVWNNLVTDSERNNTIAPVAPDVVVDPLFGDDASSTVVKSLQRAFDVLAALVTSSPTRDYTIALRSGRTELPENLVISPALNGWGGTVDDVFSASQLKFSEITINADSTARYGVRISPYLGENPVICPPTKWFFPRKAVGRYKNHSVVANHTGARFFKLFGSDGVERQCAGSWNRDTHAVQRNQNRNVTIAGVAPNITHSIRLPQSLCEVLAAASAEELASIRVRVTQWFTASWHVENMTLSGDTLSFKGYTANGAYANGWVYINADAYSAPFFIENLKAFISRDDEFSSTASDVVLPRDGSAFFTTVPLTRPSLLDFSSTKNVTLDPGISVRYVTGDPVTMAMGTWEVQKNPLAAIELGDYGAAYSSNVYGVEGDAIKLSKVGALVKGANINKVGGNSVVSVDGGHYAIIRDCFVDEHGLDQVGAFGIYVTGVEIAIFGNRVTNGGFSAIRCDSSNFITDKSYGTTMSGGIYNNIALSVGMRNGRLSERYPTGDTGVMTINGRGPATNYAVYSNVFGDCVGAGGSRAMFLDDGVNGTRIHHNVLFGAQDYSLDARQVGGNTRNNHVYSNILVGNARLYDTGNDSVFNKNILFGSIDASEGVAKYGNNIASLGNPIFCQQDDGFIKTNVQGDSLNEVLTEFTKPFVRKLSFMGI